MNIHLFSKRLFRLFSLVIIGLIVFSNSPLNAQCPDNAYWPLDEDVMGSYIDVVNQKVGNRGNASPLPTTGGIAGRAQVFNGVNSGIDVAADASFDWGADDDFSIEFWFQRAGALAGNEVVVGRIDEANDLQWWTGLWSTGKAAFVLVDTAGNFATNLTGSIALNDGDWHHVAIVRDGTNRQHLLYVDGVLDAAATVSYAAGTYAAGFDSDTAPVNIGWLNGFAVGGCCFFNGTLDEVALHDNALLAAEVAQHFDNGDLLGQGYCNSIEPDIISTEITSGTAGLHYYYNVNATGAPMPTYALTDNPAPGSMTIDGQTGVIEWLPDDGASFDMTVNAENAAGTDSQAFTLTVDAMAICDQSLISYWMLDEKAPGFYLDSFDRKDATPSDNGVSPTPIAGGIAGGAQVFDGADTGIDVAADASFDWGADDDFSIEFWFQRAGALAVNEVVVGRIDEANDLQWWTGLWSTGKAAFVLVDTAGNFATNLTGSIALNDGDWHHVAIVRDGTNREHRLYVDGVLDAAATVSYAAGTYAAGFDSDTAPLNIGWLNGFGGCCFFNGTLDEIAIYDNVLLAADIEQHFDNGDLLGQGYCDLNFSPDVIDDDYEVANGGALTEDEVTGVLSNDSDPEDDAMTAVLVDDVANGILVLDADGGFTYTHDGSNTKSDSFTYRASDGNTKSPVTAVVNITITGDADDDDDKKGGGGGGGGSCFITSLGMN